MSGAASSSPPSEAREGEGWERAAQAFPLAEASPQASRIPSPIDPDQTPGAVDTLFAIENLFLKCEIGGDMRTSAAEVRSERRACMYCGYVYDEDAGCPEAGVVPGTRWAELPDDWCCPTCSADQQDFQQL
jgi:rubredoxin